MLKVTASCFLNALTVFLYSIWASRSLRTSDRSKLLCRALTLSLLS